MAYERVRDGPGLFGIVTGIISIAGGNFLSIVQVIINIVVIWYLYRSDVKAYFGKPSYRKNLNNSLPTYFDVNRH